MKSRVFCSLLLLIVLTTMPCFSSAFQTISTNHARLSNQLLFSSKHGNNRRPPKKPRFTQDAAAPIPPRPTTGSDMAPRSDATRPRPERAARTRSSPPRATSPDSSSSRTSSRGTAAPQINKERMWKRETSIDELEARLAKRWGTDLRQWTASDDFGEDDEDDVDSSATVVPQRPVKDPWLLEENERLDQSSTVAPKSKKQSSVLGAFAKETPTTEPPRNTSPLSAFGGSRPVMDLSHLIADTPAGGEPSLETKKKKRVEKQVIPLIDNGEPLFLTLEQAERFFEQTGGLDNSSVEEKLPSWSDLGIQDERLLGNLDAMGCEMPLAVQRNSCKNILSGVDAVVGTYTGSGKTLAFLVPIIEKMVRQPELERKLRLIVVAPGRELASQIVTVARDLIAGTGLTVQLAIGGTTFSRNLEMIRKRKPDILVGTPGRIAELIVGDGERRRGRLPTQFLDTIVCDEFDDLLEYKAHRDPTHALLTTLRRQRRDRLQAILCSATASDMLKEQKKVNLEEKYLLPGYIITMAEDNDNLVTSGSKTTTRVSRTVMHGVVHVQRRRFALDTLRRILHTEPMPQQILIFVSDARRVPIVVDRLADRGIVAAPLHGDSDKADRAEVSKALRDGYVGIVVSTELAARGLDAPLLTHVINMDLPTDASHYAHRAGRCGRGGRPGVVINFTTSPQERKVPQRMADELGIDMYTVDVKNSKLNVIDPASLELDVQNDT